MKPASKDRINELVTKSCNKTITARKQFVKKNDNQLTSRQNSRNQFKISKNLSPQQKTLAKKKVSKESQQKQGRSPQMIKLMIDQLQRQLELKKVKKSLKQTASEQFQATVKKIRTSKSTNLMTKDTISLNWTSPTNKNLKNRQKQISDKSASYIENQASPKKVLKKKKLNVVQKLEQINQQKVFKKRKEKNLNSKKDQNFIFLGDDLIQIANVSMPLFVLQNNSTFNYSRIYPSKNQRLKDLDQKSLFLRHSKVSSFQSVNIENQLHVRHIERSFLQSQETDVTSQELILTKESKQRAISCRKQNLQVKQNQETERLFDFNAMILFNSAVILIQKWWKKTFLFKQMKRQHQEQVIKQSKQTIETKQQSQKHIVKQIQNDQRFKNLKQTGKKSQSQNCIKSTQIQHEDILKLRQNAAYLQFLTHQQILKELLSKSKISQTLYSQKQCWISKNLQKQISDIQNIKAILRESARKVQTMMKKTKEDIISVKKMSLIQNQNQQTDINPCFSSRNAGIISEIFGIENQQQASQIENKKFITQEKHKRLLALGFQNEMDQFINQNSEQQSFLSDKNGRIFNSPNTGSQEDLCSPSSNTNSDYKQAFQEQQNLQEIFTNEVCKAPASSSEAEAVLPMQNANFQQLYKEFQQQESTKKCIQSRIAKQLGMSQQAGIPKYENQLGINTSIVGIHKFLLNFFKFYLYYHKSQFLNYMNMPYGESIQVRLAKNKLQNSQQSLSIWNRATFYTEDDDEVIYGLRTIIQPRILEQFYESYYEQTDVQFNQVEKTNIELEKIHNKAIFEAFNEALNVFRPYYNIKGAPYLWCSSEKSLTFYCIGEQNIQEVYEKTQMKILKNSSYLCGAQIDIPHKNSIQYCKEIQNQTEQINSPFKVLDNQQSVEGSAQCKKISNFQEFIYSYTQNFNPAYFSCLEERLKKKQQAETQEQNLEWFSNTFEEGKVSVLFNLTELIEEIILLQECSILQNMQVIKQKMKQNPMFNFSQEESDF